jgi:hypothetical protein
MNAPLDAATIAALRGHVAQRHTTGVLKPRPRRARIDRRPPPDPSRIVVWWKRQVVLAFYARRDELPLPRKWWPKVCFIHGAEAPEPEGAPEGTAGTAEKDFVTLLTAAEKSKILTKRILLGVSGPVIRDYDLAKHFLFEKKEIRGLSDIKRVFDDIGPNTAIVLGAPTDAAVMGARRLLRDDPRTGDRATLVVTKHPWVLIDCEGIPCPEGLDPIADPEAAVRYVVSRYLPAEMHDRDVLWQLTSGAGFKPDIRLRLGFWLDRLLSCEEMKQWLGELHCVDDSIYTANQLIYCAKPVFGKGVSDPVARRSGILVGRYRAVTPPDPLVRREGERPNGGAAKPTGFAGGSNGGARGFAAWCRRIGDHAEGEGFHRPIVKAVGAYVGANGSANTELLRAQLERAIRDAPRDPTAHSDSYIEKQIRDLPGLIGLTQERDAQPRPLAEDATAAEVIAQRIAVYNQHFAVVQVGNRVAILREYLDDDDRPTFALLGVDAFKTWQENDFIELPNKHGEPQKVAAALLWLKSPTRREYNGIVFKPGKATPHYYNLWRGFAVVPSEAGSCALFKAHLLDNVCQGNEELFRWVFGWFAHIIQHPADKCGTALVLRGKQGVGKTIVGKTIGRLIGDRIHYLKVASPRFVTGRFNAHLEGILLFHCDEAFWAGDHAAEGLIKDLITGEDHPIERKGIEVTVVDNYVRVLISGNEDWLVPAGLDERRFAVIDVGEAHQQDTPYFKAITKELEAGGYERLMHELLSFDLSQVELRVIPKTEALLDQKMEALKPEQSWWFNTLETGQLPYSKDLLPNRCVREVLFDSCKEHSQQTGVKRRALDTKLGKFLKRVVPGLTAHQVTYRGRVVRIYTFPSLADCRAAFAHELRQELRWDGPEEWVSAGGVVATSLTELHPVPLYDLPPEE